VVYTNEHKFIMISCY